MLVKEVKEQICQENVDDMELIHKALEEKNYFNLQKEENREAILVTLFIHLTKAWYFAGVKNGQS